MERIEMDKKTKKCPYCGEEILEKAIKCKHCGEMLKQNIVQHNMKKCPFCAEYIPQNANYCNICESSLDNIKSNNATPSIEFSTEQNNKIDKNYLNQWNWGAFWFTWIWGIANKSYLTLLTLIPCFNFVWMFVCGFKGNEWAWKNKSWTSIEEFTQVQKKWATISNIIVGIILVLSIVLLSIACIIEDNNLTITSVLSKCGATESYQEFEYSGNDEYVGTYNATKYTCNNENFNQVIRFKKDEKSSEETYAFRVETNEQAGNGGENFNYEIGRIVIDTVNPNSDKCTYNYRGNADWKPCSEKDFIKSLPKISSMKAKAYEPLKPLMKELIEWDIKDLNWAPDYDEQKAEETYEKYEKQLKILRNVSLDN